MSDVVPAAPSDEFEFAGYKDGRPTFLRKDRKEPPALFGLVFSHFNTLGAPEFAKPSKPLRPLPGFNLPLWERTEFGVKHRQASADWPFENWKPLCDRARQVREYYDQHRGEPGFPVRAWNESTDRLCTFEDPKGLASAAPRRTVEAGFAAQGAAEAATRTTPVHASLPQRLSSSDFPSGRSEPRIKAPTFKPRAAS